MKSEIKTVRQLIAHLSTYKPEMEVRVAQELSHVTMAVCVDADIITVRHGFSGAMIEVDPNDEKDPESEHSKVLLIS